MVWLFGCRAHRPVSSNRNAASSSAFNRKKNNNKKRKRAPPSRPRWHLRRSHVVESHHAFHVSRRPLLKLTHHRLQALHAPCKRTNTPTVTPTCASQESPDSQFDSASSVCARAGRSVTHMVKHSRVHHLGHLLIEFGHLRRVDVLGHVSS